MTVAAAFVSAGFPLTTRWNGTPSISTQTKRLRRPRGGQSQPRLSIAPELIQFSGASEFEIRRYIGSLGFKTVVDWDYIEFDPMQPKRTVDASRGPQVRLYDARCIGRSPALYNTRVQLKEFLPDGQALAVAEAEAYQALYASKGESNIDPDVAPVATLLGSFLADEAFGQMEFAARWAQQFPRSPKAPQPGSPWLVFRYEGNLTAAQFPGSPRNDSAGGLFFDRLFPRGRIRRTEDYLVQLLRKSLLALQYLHSAGIAHRSLSSHSLLVNTLEDRLGSSLQVKLRDLGFAKSVSKLLSSDELDKARKAGAETPTEITSYFFCGDIYDLGYAFCELIFGSLVSDTEGELPDASQDRFKTLFEDTFDLSADRCREYCAAEATWEPAVAFCDSKEMAGWNLLATMLGARKNFRTTNLNELLASPLLDGAR
jgi:serine/threonine protein kinase